ncbi:MAG: ABC transporter ATP-binding protein [Alphaproteobacteria bacterium]|nr:MAG: ABC transporter ATP-binding protein [Alphaproteobacteria bacterium]TAF16022.1 MAG: ABC transporter ATP-binding protein [Alphaproteobacteria bacterium]TAF76205.1 MAG: ABC transporter ATP-binding protein [Alphaproteobacteria bacterium]
MLRIECKGLSKRFGSVHAVRNLSLSVANGEVLGFLGPNGAGKTTTMRMITGYLTPDAGSITIDGIDVMRHPVEAQQRIGYVPEGVPLYPEMTPYQLLCFMAKMRGLSRARTRERLELVIGWLQLESVLEQPIDTLSKGYKRRVGMAQAIIHDPEVLILDEPTDGLDPLQKREVRALIRSMAQHKAMIISTHILEEVDAVCSRAVIISNGTLIADGTPAQLRATYKNDNLDEVFCMLAQQGNKQ